MAEVQALAGKRMVSYFRLLKNATKEKAEIVPLEGDSSISFKRSSKSTTTKSGNISRLKLTKLSMKVSLKFQTNSMTRFWTMKLLSTG